MTPKYRVIIPDLPGFGESTRIQGAKYTNLAQAERLKKFVDAIGLQKFHIVGNSMGGNISGNFTADNQERVITLALFDAAGVKGPVKSEHELQVEKGFNPLLAHGVEDYDRLIAFAFTSPPFIPYPFKKVTAEISAGREEFYGYIYSQISVDRFELQKKLPKISLPTLIVWGDQDRIINVANAGVFAKGIKNSRVVIMKQCGHVPMIERPEEAARIYLDFLNEKK
jgi:pimeloyl-ACP methyl ester carboxylesterase